MKPRILTLLLSAAIMIASIPQPALAAGVVDGPAAAADEAIEEQTEPAAEGTALTETDPAAEALAPAETEPTTEVVAETAAPAAEDAPAENPGEGTGGEGNTESEGSTGSEGNTEDEGTTGDEGNNTTEGGGTEEPPAAQEPAEDTSAPTLPIGPTTEENGITWSISEDGLLEASGSVTAAGAFPWETDAYKPLITSAKITLSGCTTLSGILSGCTNLVTADFTGAKTASVTDMSGMFEGCENLTTITFGNFNSGSVTTTARMFKGCAKLNSVDLSWLGNAESINTIDEMFSGCAALNQLDLGYDLQLVMNAKDLLTGCESLEKITAPIKLGTNVDVALPASGTTGTTLWKGSDGKACEILPQGLSTPVGLTRTVLPKSVSISVDNATLKVGETATATVTFEPSGVTAAYVFKSGDDSILAIDSQGRILAIGEGEAEVWLETTGDLELTSNRVKIAVAKGDTTAYEIKYTVAFDKNDPSAIGTMKNQSFVYGKKQNLSDNTFINSGYSFSEWNTQPDGSGSSYKNRQAVTAMTSEDGARVVLYAQWKPKAFNQIDLSPTSCTITVGGTGVIEAKPFPEDVNENENFKITFTSSDESCVTVTTAGSFGWVKGVKAGTALITAVASFDDGEEVTATCPVTVAEGSGERYRVVFDGNGALDGVMYEQSFARNEKKALSSNAYKRPGYTFKCWNTKADGKGTKYTDGQYVSGLSKDYGSDIEVVLYAQWTADTFTVKYNGGGYAGVKGSMSDQKFSFGDTKALTANKYKRAGYEFKGWADGNGNLYADKQKVANIAMDTSAITLTAQWTPIRYTITYMNTPAGNDQFKYYTVEDEVTLPVLDEPGYTFDGWYKNKSCSASKKVANGVLPKGTTGNLKLYPKLVGKSYTITFDGNGATSGSMVSKNYTYGKATAIAANKFKKSGSVFVGWNTKEDGTGDSFSNKEKIKGVIVDGAASDIKLYAQWGYKITYKNAARSSAITNTNPSYYTIKGGVLNIDAATMADPVKKGYYFDGWYTDKKYNNKFTGINTDNPKNITLYAKWVAKSVELTYDDGVEGSSQQKKVTVTYGKNKALPANSLKRTGFKFAGWYDGYGKKPIANKAKILTVDWYEKICGDSATGAASFTAVWTYGEYKITYSGAVEGKNNVWYNDNPATYISGQKLVLTEPKRAGYSFVAWYEDKGKTKKIENNILDTNQGTNLTVYADWKKDTSKTVYLIDYVNAKVGRNGVTKNESPCSYYEGETVKVSKFKTPVRVGYRFDGWYTDEECKEAFKSFDGSTKETLTIYAKWVPVTYAIKYDANAPEDAVVTGTMLTQKATYGQKVTLLVNRYQREGYRFLGWSTTRSSRIVEYSNVETVKNITDGGTATLYAVWEKQ